MSKVKKTFLGGASILAVSVIIAKILGAVYRIPLTYILGAEGMGIYQFVYPIFALLLTLSCGAVPTAISISVARKLANGDEEGARTEFFTIFKLCLYLGLAGTLTLALLAYPLSLLQVKDAFLGYICISPAVFIVTLISAYRGYFMARKDMTPSSISQITEGLVKLAAGITLTKLLLPYGLKFAVAGALTGVVASELVTLIILASIYAKKGEGYVRIRLREQKPILKDLAKLTLPLVLCGMVLPLSQFVDSVLLVNLLRWGGLSDALATGNYGIYTGTVTPLVNLPVMVCITLGIAITPQMVEGKERKDVDFIMDKVNTATKATFVMGVPFVFMFIFLAPKIVGLLYPRLTPQGLELATTLLQISSVSVLGLSIFQIYSAMLQGLNKPYVPLKIMTISVVVKLVLSVILVPIMGIKGGAIAATVAFTGAGIAIMGYFSFFVRRVDNLLKNASLITLCGVIMGVIILSTVALQVNNTAVAIIATISLAVYFLGLLFLRVFSQEELASLPLSRFLLWLDKTIH